MSFVGTVLVGSTLLLAAAALAAGYLRTASASTRHALWAITLGGLLLLPLAEGLLPKLEWQLLPPAGKGQPSADGRRVDLSATVTDGEGDPEASLSLPVSVPSGFVEPEVLPTLPIAPRSSMPDPWGWPEWMAAVWVLGAMVIALRLLIGTWSVRRLWNSADESGDPEWVRLVEDLGPRMGIRVPVQLRISDEAIPPMTLGFVGRLVLLPRGAVSWSHDRRRIVMAHELAHIRRRDGLTQLLAQIVQALYWFHPLVWYATRRLAEERERATDDQVLALHTQRVDYAEHLVAVTRSIGSGVSLATLTMSEPSRLETRLLAILDPKTSRQAVSRFGVAFLGLAVVALTLPAATLRLTAMVGMPVARVEVEAAPSVPNFEPPGVGRQLEEEGLAIAGTVLAPGTREPVAGIDVELSGGRGGVTRTVATDSQGRFRFEGLQPREYSLTPLTPTDGAIGAARKTVDLGGAGIQPDVQLWMAPWSMISGRVVDPDGEPVRDAQVRAGELEWMAGQRVLDVNQGRWVRTDEDGRYTLPVHPGEYRIQVLPERDAYPVHYYPGVVYPGDAIPIRVIGGIDIPAVDVTLERVDQFRVRFSFPSANPAPPPDVQSAGLASRRNTSLMTAFRFLGPGLQKREWEAQTLGDLGDSTYQSGPFPPGEYDLIVGSGRALRDQLTRIRFTIEDKDLDLGTILPGSYPDIPGRVTVGFGQAADTIQLDELPALQFRDGIAGIGADSPVANDGTFTLERVPPGLYSLYSGVLPEDWPSGWYIAAVRSGARNVLTDGLVVGEGQIAPLEVVISGDAATLQGVVRTTSGDLVPGARVVLIPPGTSRGPLSRFPATVANDAGAWALNDIPPGDYRLLALDLAGLEDSRVYSGLTLNYRYWESPDFLRQYELRGERITVDPGARLTINPEPIPLVD